MDNTSTQIHAEINKLAKQIRTLRVTGADYTQVRALEERLRTRWADLRAHRAGANANPNAAHLQPERRSSRWSR
jgi:hypothetical protein